MERKEQQVEVVYGWGPRAQHRWRAIKREGP